jgi:serine/threonine protein kinase
MEHGLELREQIGFGGFGVVYTVWHMGYQQTLVVKIADVKASSWMSELESLKAVYHPNVVKVYDTFQDDHFGYMLLEYCQGGNMEDRIKEFGPLSFREFKEVAYQLCDALECCHAVGISHLDIKPANVFYCGGGKVRLGDFGCSGRKSDCFFGGSAPYMSPEIVCQVMGFDKYLSDIWSLGVTFYFLASGKLPWKNKTASAIQAEIRMGAYVPITDVDSRIPPLIKSMLKIVANERASLQSLMEMISSWGTNCPASRKSSGLFAPGWRLSYKRHSHSLTVLSPVIPFGEWTDEPENSGDP